MNTLYILGFNKQQVKNKIKELNKKGYKIIDISIGRFNGTSEYYGVIYYEHI